MLLDSDIFTDERNNLFNMGIYEVADIFWIIVIISR